MKVIKRQLTLSIGEWFMNASLKTKSPQKNDRRKQSIRNIRQIESKMTNLQHQYQQLLKVREQELATLMSRLNLSSVEDQLLVGGLMFIREKIEHSDQILEDWQKAGDHFLRQTKKEKRPLSFPAVAGSFKATVAAQRRSQSGEN